MKRFNAKTTKKMKNSNIIFGEIAILKSALNECLNRFNHNETSKVINCVMEWQVITNSNLLNLKKCPNLMVNALNLPLECKINNSHFDRIVNFNRVLIKCFKYCKKNHIELN